MILLRMTHALVTL